ncbi:hypothetical protein JL722_4278 [Aureococcus anophagefferens]|nr:hypothetical protein JL722_4278 [Aureococcus anophagefferens]
MRFHPGKPVPPRKSYREAEPCCAAPSCWRNLKRPAPTPGSAKAECAARKKRRQLARGPRGEPRRGTDAADMSSSAGAAAAAEPLKCVPCDACALGTPEEKDFGQALGARERAEMTSAGLRARAYSSPDFRAFPVPEDSAVDFDSDGFAKPAPRSPVRERSCSSLDAFAAAASPPPAPAVDVHA